jgi:hypothetical protein
MKIHHDDPYAGHFAAKQTKELLSCNYYWQGLQHDVEEYISMCAVCQHIKIPHHKLYGQLASLPIASKPWESISMDFITGLPLSKRHGITYDAILVVIDCFTKIARYLSTTSTITAFELADLFSSSILKDFSALASIISDRRSLFTSGFWSSLCFHLKIKQKLSTAFHPQTDGQSNKIKPSNTTYKPIATIDKMIGLSTSQQLNLHITTLFKLPQE